MDNKEFLQDYEITGWQTMPKTSRFLGIAAGINLFALIILGQFNLLQNKACDSPYVGKVCQILDVVSLSKDLSETNTEFSDQAYDPTEIKEGDVTYIDVSGQEPPFTYPEGYFALANPPEEMGGYPMTDFGGTSTDFGGITTVPAPSEGGLPPQVLPTPNDRVANQDVPESPFDFGGTVKQTPPPRQTTRTPSYTPRPTTRRPPIRNNSPSKLPTLPGEETAGNSNSNGNSSNTTAQNNSNSNANNLGGAAEDDGKFNSLPLKNFGDEYGQKILNKEVDINAPFTIEVIGRLDEKGKIVDPKMQASPDSDPKMTEVAKKAIEAFSDTKLLKPLYDAIEGREKNKKPKNIKITFSQNKDNLQAIILSEAKDEASAKSISSGLNLLVKTSSAFMREDSDEAKLMSRAQFNTQGKILVINFLMANEEKTQLIEKSLKSLAEKKKQGNTGEPGSQALSSK